MEKRAISVGTTLGPYSPGLEFQHTDRVLFVSGQIPIDAEGNVVSTEFAAQAAQVFNNIRGILKAGEYEMKDVLKLTIYLTDLSNFAAVNEECKKNFAEPFPARATVQISALPKGVLLEVEAIAAR
ncbi:Rid family detoxifying hydrolase [Candidatus Gracilibacteria bacterium]|nr:Rid family detoxifying hydrolase [Candidatus Gracilibacteria bacterium]